MNPAGLIRWSTGARPPVFVPGVMIAAVWLGFLVEARASAPNPDEEREAAARPAIDRPAFLRRRALLRAFVAGSLGLPADRIIVATDPDGVPRLVRPAGGLFVSSASREGCFALALAAAPVGVDLEIVSEPAEPAWNVLTDAERQALTKLQGPARWAAFLRLWTAKEAYLKAIGLGLAREPGAIGVGGDNAPVFTISDHNRAVELAVAEARALTLRDVRLQAACVVLRT